MSKRNLPQKLPKGYILLLIATIIWAGAGPVIKFTLSYIPPLTFIFLRFLIACAVLLPYTFYEIQKVKINPKDFFNFFLLGLFSQTSLALIFVGLKFTTVIDSTIIGILGSILSIAAGNYFYKEKISRNLKIGLALSILGTIIVVLEPFFSGVGGAKIVERIFGNSLLLIHNIAWVVFIIWSKMSMGERSSLLKKTLSFVHLKPMTKDYPPTLITSICMFVGLFTVAPLAVIEIAGGFGYVQFFNILEIDISGIMGLLYMSLLSSLVAYILFQKAMTTVKVSDNAFFHYLSPLFTLPIAYLLLGEIPNMFVIVGAIFIAAGVYIAEVRNADR